MKISGIIYDLDDTLISRDEAFYSGFTTKFYENFVDQNNIDFETFFQIMKDADKLTKWSPEKENLFNELRKKIELNKENDFYVNFFWDSIVKSVKPDLEANKHLEKLNGIKFPWGVLTNGYKYQHEKMKRSGVGNLAPFYIVSGDFGCHKPCKEVFIEASKKINLPCEEILFVGDTAETDIIGAQSVGMKTAWIRMARSYPLENKPDFEIDHVKELGSILNLF
ncbi:MAG: HAD family hydrolase [Chloroflexi bacterium]|nr:HAD family hydrolase [Chloroflexota bacterium]